jgi:hypothetical protein
VLVYAAGEQTFKDDIQLLPSANMNSRGDPSSVSFLSRRGTECYADSKLAAI